MEGPPSPDMRIGGARQRRASASKRREAVDRVDRNKTDSIEWAKQRRAKAAAAEAKREERRRAQAAAIKAQEEYEEQLEQYFMDLFRIADTNGDGVLQKLELQTLLEASGMMVDASDMAKLMPMIDVNGDGVIQYAEFLPLITAIVVSVTAFSCRFFLV